MKDLHNKITVLRAISPVSVSDNTALVGQIISTIGTNALEYVIAVGTVADADATFVTLVEHGNDPSLSDAEAVPDTFLLGTENAASFQFDDDNETRKIGYIGPKAYTRLTITPANNASAAVIGALAIVTPQDLPAA